MTTLANCTNEQYYSILKNLPKRTQRELSSTCSRFYEIFFLVNRTIPDFLNVIKEYKSFSYFQQYKFSLNRQIEIILQIHPFLPPSEEGHYYQSQGYRSLNGTNIDRFYHYVAPFYMLNGKISGKPAFSFLNALLIQNIQTIFERLLQYLIDPRQQFAKAQFIKNLYLMQFGPNQLEKQFLGLIHRMSSHLKELMQDAILGKSEKYVFQSIWGKITLITGYKNTFLQRKIRNTYSFFPYIKYKTIPQSTYASTYILPQISFTCKIKLPFPKYHSLIILKAKEIVTETISYKLKLANKSFSQSLSLLKTLDTL